MNQDEIDLDTAEAQKMFADAFASASKGETIKIVEPVTAVEPTTTPEPIIPEPVVEAAPTEPVVAKTTETPSEDVPKVVETKNYNVPDWAKDLPDNVKESLSKELQDKLYYEQKYKSDLGRQSALQRKLYEARKENAALRTHIAKPQDPAIATAAKRDQASTLAEWKQLQEADPDLAKAFDARLDERVTALRAEQKAQLDATVNPLNQHIEENYEDEQRRLLLEQVPNFQEVVNNPVYSEWLNTRASQGVRNLALNSMDYKDALTVLKMYAQEGPDVYNDMIRAGKMPAPKVEDVVRAPSPVPSQQVDTTNADRVARSREQKILAPAVLKEAPNPNSATAAVAAIWNNPKGEVNLDDPSVVAAFEDAYKKHQIQRVR